MTRYAIGTLRPDPAGPLETRLPTPYAGYFELAFVLDAVAAAAEAESFTMLELGSGYGPWLATAHRARQLSGQREIRLVGVEMVAQHFQWMHEHFANNRIDVREHRLIEAAISEGQEAALRSFKFANRIVVQTEEMLRTVCRHGAEQDRLSLIPPALPSKLHHPSTPDHRIADLLTPGHRHFL